MSNRSKFRLLFIYVGARTHNPTVPTLIGGFKHIENSDVRCIDLLVTSLHQLATHLSWASVALIEHTVLMSRSLPNGVKHFIHLNTLTSAEHMTNAISMILDSDRTLALLAGNYDLHAPLGGDLSSEELRRFSILVWPYMDRPISLDQVTEKYREAWMHSRLDPLNNWATIRKQIPLQVEYTHMLDVKEILNGQKVKRYQASVPGVPYVTRQIATDSAKISGLTLAPISKVDRTIRSFTKVMSYGPFSKSAQSIRFTLRQANMRNLVRASRTAYVCGGGYEYFVRKFLEVPAFGTPMVAYPINALERLGFIPYVNFVPALPEEYGEKALELLQAPYRAAEIAHYASTLLYASHTAEIRIKDLILVLHSIFNESASEGRFKNGRLSMDS